MIAEAVDTAATVGWAIVAWICVGAAVATGLCVGLTEVTRRLSPWGPEPPSRATHPRSTPNGPPRPAHAPN